MLTPEEQATEQAQATEAAVEIPKGRVAFMAQYKQNNPDSEGDPDDDTLYDYAGKGWNERNELETMYKGLNSSNETLAKAVGQYPQFAKLIAMIGAGENPWKALGSIIGPKADNLDEGSIEQLRTGQADFNKRMEVINGNIEKYKSTLDAYVEQNSLTPADRETIHNTILDMIDAFIDYDIDESIIDNVWKGIDYDEARGADDKAKELSIRNKTIDEMKTMKRAESPVPDMAGAGSKKGVKPKFSETADVPYKPLSQTMDVIRK